MEKELKTKRRGHEIGFAIFLVTLGVFSMFSAFIGRKYVGLFFLPCLGLSFFIWSMLSKEEGLLIPAQILVSLGVAVILLSTFFETISPTQKVSVNLISMGLGWILIAVISRLALKKNLNWGFIPGGILVILGLVFLFPEPALSKVLNVLGYLKYAWPFAPIILGVLIILGALKKRSN